MESIFNRPPSISEDTLQYHIFPSPASDKTTVITLAVAIQSFLDSALIGFIWHRDAFELKLSEDQDSGLWSLTGRMRVGDSIDDEWCVVWLLREISQKWDVVISVYDADGDFLLIEAADSLPSWVTPSNAENRVWIYNSHLHLIPLSHVSPPSSKRRRRRLPGANESDDEGDAVHVDEDDFLSLPQALQLVRDHSIDTSAPPTVERAVWKRITGYPGALKQHVHKTKAFIPADIMKALLVNPNLVQKAVETFYTRDAVQLRAAHKMSRFPPSSSCLGTIWMTRTAYAQVVGQKFYPPKIFGQSQEKEGSQTWRWKDIGMKIACGFEMLYQDSKGRLDGSNTTAATLRASAEARKDALRRDMDYVKYAQSLVSAGYFRGEVEGSQLWKELEDQAVDVYLHTKQEDDSSRPTFASMVNEAISKADNLSLQHNDEPEDSDDWLNVDAQDFDTLLQARLGLKNPGSDLASNDAMDVDKLDARVAKDQSARLQDLAKKVENFLDGKGNIEGAVFDDEQSSDDEMSELSDEPFSESSTDSDDEGEPTTGNSTARQEAMEKLVPGIDPSEYGKMPPSFHSNSQRVTATTVDNDVVGDIPGNPTTSGSTLPQKPIRAPILMRDTYEGVDSDDETDEEDEPGDEEDEEDRPQVIGDVEVDMGEEEEEFLEFSRQALGISDDQWADILQERKNRGAFVPSHVTNKVPHKSKPNGSPPPAPSPDAEPKLRTPAPGPRPNANPNLDSFEAVMQAMEAELVRSREEKTAFKPPSTSTQKNKEKGKGKATEPVQNEDTDVDIEAAMEAELKDVLGQEADDDGIELDAEGGMDYNLIKNFLESFKSQGGLSGPVSNLAGRLQPGWSMPRDDGA
ncbi:SGT1-domain-containing protein [Amylostereum chailletii]|nr:SGT1-domain-containing protein [Amylostereum chailletii]